MFDPPTSEVDLIRHDLRCKLCYHIEWGVPLDSSNLADLPLCKCGGSRDIHWSRAYANQFGGTWNGLSTDKVVVYTDPAGHVVYPGRTDRAMPERYRREGFERKELAPFEVTAFEKKNNVIVESLHFNRNGSADREDPPPPEPRIEYSDLTSA